MLSNNHQQQQQQQHASVNISSPKLRISPTANSQQISVNKEPSPRMTNNNGIANNPTASSRPTGAGGPTGSFASSSVPGHHTKMVLSPFVETPPVSTPMFQSSPYDNITISHNHISPRRNSHNGQDCKVGDKRRRYDASETSAMLEKLTAGNRLSRIIQDVVNGGDTRLLKKTVADIRSIAGRFYYHR